MSYYYGSNQPVAPKRRGCALGCGFWFGLLFILLLALGVYGYYAYSALNRAYPHLQSGVKLSTDGINAVKDKLTTTSLSSLTQTDYDNASKAFTDGAKEFDAAKNELQYVTPVLSYLSWVPKYGSDLGAFPHLLNMATAMSTAGNALTTGMQKVVKATTCGSQMKCYVVTAASEIKQTMTALDQAQAERAQIDDTKLSVQQLRDAVAEYDKFDVKNIDDQLKALLDLGKQ